MARLAALFMVCLLLSIQSLQATPADHPPQWHQLGPDGGSIAEIVVDPKKPKTLYAGTSSGSVYKSLDAGMTWQLRSNGLHYNEAALFSFDMGLAISPSTPTVLYAKGWPGLFITRDGGMHWSEISPEPMRLFNDVAVDPQVASTVYASTFKALFKSVDYGENWTQVYTSEVELGSIAVDPQIPSTIMLGGEGSIIKSVDGGSNWQVTPLNAQVPPMADLVIDPAKSAVAYALPRNSSMGLKTVDGGTHWFDFSPFGFRHDTSNRSYELYKVVVDPTNSAVVYLNTSQGMYRSVNAGLAWVQLKPFGSNQVEAALAIDPVTPTTLYTFEAAEGVLKSMDNGQTWVSINTGIRHQFISSIAINPANPMTIYAGNRYDGVFKSVDRGHTWDKLDLGVQPKTVDEIVIDPETPTTLYARTAPFGMYKSLDAGTTWQASNDGIPEGISGSGTFDIAEFALNPSRPSIVYALTASTLYISTNNAETWTEQKTFSTTSTLYALTTDPVVSGTLYLATDQQVFKSTDHGGSWTDFPIPTLLDPYRQIVVDPNNPTTIYARSNTTIATSTDGGINWTTQEFMDGIWDLAIDPNIPTTLYLGRAGGLLKSLDGGATWSAIETDAGAVCQKIAFHPFDSTVVYCGTAGDGMLTNARLYTLFIPWNGK